VPFEHIGALIQKFDKLEKEEQRAFQRLPLQKLHLFISISENGITVQGNYSCFTTTEFKRGYRPTRKILLDMQGTVVFV
jgi:hypothetical protein